MKVEWQPRRRESMESKSWVKEGSTMVRWERRCGGERVANHLRMAERSGVGGGGFEEREREAFW